MAQPLARSAPRAVPAVMQDDDAAAPIEPNAEAEVPIAEPSAAEALGADFEDEADFPDEGAVAKEALKAEVAEGLRGPRPDRAVVGEILLALEASNPTRSPATSPLLNGKWKFLYASGASPGLKALSLLLKGSSSAPKSPSGADLVDVADTFLTITDEQPRATAEVSVRLLSFESTVKR